jgi:hypothetical protein
MRWPSRGRHPARLRPGGEAADGFPRWLHGTHRVGLAAVCGSSVLLTGLFERAEGGRDRAHLALRAVCDEEASWQDMHGELS